MSKISRGIKEKVISRAGGLCEYCLSQEFFSPSTFSVDHVVPQSKGGNHGLDNLALACQGCNNYKYTRTEYLDPLNDEIAPLFNPRKQNWRDHFSWNNDCSLILGKSSIGRATISCLRLNRENLIQIRKVLFDAGLHPPESK